jgi:hypothetical protein
MRTPLILSLVLACGTASAADKVVLVAGGGEGADGTEATKAKLVQPFAVDFDKEGNIYFVEMAGGERLRKIDAKGVLTTLAGTGKKGDSGDKGPGAKAEFNGMHNLIWRDEWNFVLVADTFNNRLRYYDLEKKTVHAHAGTGKKGFAGDGELLIEAQFNQPICIAQDPFKNYFYVADIGNRRIRQIGILEGIVLTYAGNGKAGVPKDGEPAKDQPLIDPRAVAADKDGNVYILERSGHALRVVDKAGKIRTVAGTGKAGSGGDGGPALKALMNGPKFISIDPADQSVLIADTENHRILRYIPKTETMELVAGTGKKGSAGLGGEPKKLELSRPHGVCVHPKTGDIYIADSDNNRIVKIVRE